MSKQNHGEVWRRRAFRFSVLLCVIALCLSAGLAISYKRWAWKRASDAKEEVKDKTSKIAESVAKHLNLIKPEVKKLAGELSSGELPYESVPQRLRDVYKQYSDDWGLLEVGVAYEPEQSLVAPDKGSAPHCGLKEGIVQDFDVSEDYDYLKSPWFEETKEGPHWIEPYFGEATQRWTAGYAAPFKRASGNFAGVVRMNFDLDKIKVLVAEMVAEFLARDEDLVLRAGYLLLMSAQNKIITHPIKSYIGKNIAELSKTDRTLQAITDMLNGNAVQKGSVDEITEITIVDEITGESYWIFKKNVTSAEKNVTSANWKAVVVLNKRKAQDSAKTVRIYQRSISATVVVFLCGVSFLLLHAYRGSEASLWRFSIVSSLLFCAGTVTTWTLAVTGESRSKYKSVHIFDAPTAEATVSRYLLFSKSKSPSDEVFRIPDEVFRIPTGVFVQSLTFTSANNVHLTGYIWQREADLEYDLEVTDKMDKIPEKGKSLVIVAKVNDQLHFRIFDPQGKKVRDKSEKQLSNSFDELNVLKKELQELSNRKDFPARFKITEQSLENLKSEYVPDDVLEKLEEIKGQEGREKEKFLTILKNTFGEERTVQYESYKSTILKHADISKSKEAGIVRSVTSIIGHPRDLLGFILPEAEELDRKPAYENDDVIGWYFETTLRQQFDYSRYPFDREDVWIRLWPESINPNVILVPDLTSYHVKKDEIAGVEDDFVLEGWEIKNSYFSFRTNHYNVDFGQPGFNDERLELYFSIGLRRNFVSAFISDMIPILVIAFLAFAVLMSSTRHKEKIDLYGFSTSAVLGYCAALFFVLIVSHVHLRNTLATQGIIYMEYFYFVMYLVILAVSTDSLLFASSRNFAFIHYNDNIIVKQLYWPLLTGSLFVITLIVFR